MHVKLLIESSRAADHLQFTGLISLILTRKAASQYWCHTGLSGLVRCRANRLRGFPSDQSPHQLISQITSSSLVFLVYNHFCLFLIKQMAVLSSCEGNADWRLDHFKYHFPEGCLCSLPLWLWADCMLRRSLLAFCCYSVLTISWWAEIHCIRWLSFSNLINLSLPSNIVALNNILFSYSHHISHKENRVNSKGAESDLVRVI